MLSAFGCEQVVQIVVLLFCRDGHHPLMIAGLGQAGELVTGNGPYRNAGCTTKLGDLLNTGVGPAACDSDILKSASTGGQCFLNRMDTEDDLHWSQCTS